MLKHQHSPNVLLCIILLLQAFTCQWSLCEQLQEIFIRFLKFRKWGFSRRMLLATAKMAFSGNENGSIFALATDFGDFIWYESTFKNLYLLMNTFKNLIWKVKIYTLDHSFERSPLPHSCFSFLSSHDPHNISWLYHIYYFYILLIALCILCAHNYIKWNE